MVQTGNIKTKPLSQTDKKGIQKECAKFIAKGNHSLTFFEKECNRDFVRFLLGSKNPNWEVYCPSRRTIDRVMKESDAEMTKLIKSKAEILCESGCWITADDWNHSRGTFEPESDYRSAKLCVRRQDGSFLSYTILFRISSGKSHRDAQEDLLAALDEYGLKEYVLAGVVPILADHALRGAMAKMTPSSVTCAAHTLNRVTKRLIENKATELPGFESKFQLSL